MTTDNTYNGWSNYETWRINLEWFDGMEFEHEETGDSLRAMVEEIIDSNHDYAYIKWMVDVTLDKVNWDEIAQHINETWELV